MGGGGGGEGGGWGVGEEEGEDEGEVGTISVVRVSYECRFICGKE